MIQRYRLRQLNQVSAPEGWNGDFVLLGAIATDHLSNDNINRYAIHVSDGRIEFDMPGEKVFFLFERTIAIMEDLTTIFALLERVEWQLAMWRQGALTDDQIQRYLRADVHHFHSEMRSIFDYVAQCLERFAVAPGKCGGAGSFNKLRNWCNKSFKNRATLGEDLARLLFACDWFDEIKDIRDDLTHRARDAEVRVTPNDELLFQTFRYLSPSLITTVPKCIMHGEWIRFQAYAGLYIGRLLWYLDRFAFEFRDETLNYAGRNFQWLPDMTVTIRYMRSARECLAQAQK